MTDFNLVVTHGGIGRASRASGRPKATLSRRVKELEVSLGVRLFEHGSRSLRLTEMGSTLHARTKGLLGEIVEVGEAISEGIARPRGRLRVSSPLLFAHTSFGPIAAAFIQAYPDIRLEIIAGDRAVDPVEEGYDLVIRANPAPDDKLVGRCFLRDQMLIVAPTAVAGPSPASDPDATVSVPAVVLTTPADLGLWRIADGGHELNLRPDPVLRLSSKLMVRDAVRVGVALPPRSVVADDLASGRLASWGEALGHGVELWVLHTPGRIVSGKVAAFVKFLCAAFAGASP